MAVITKKNEKLSCVVNELDANHTADKFKDIFPKDWDKVEHETKTKPGKTRPMPEPV